MGIGFAGYHPLSTNFVANLFFDLNVGFPYKNSFGNDVELSNSSLAIELGVCPLEGISFSAGLGWAMFNSLYGASTTESVAGHFYFPSYSISHRNNLFFVAYRNLFYKFQPGGGFSDSDLTNQYSGSQILVGFNFFGTKN